VIEGTKGYFKLRINGNLNHSKKNLKNIKSHTFLESPGLPVTNLRNQWINLFLVLFNFLYYLKK